MLPPALCFCTFFVVATPHKSTFYEWKIRALGQNEDMSSLTLDTPINLSVSMLDPLLGYVARTAVTVSVPNAHLDPRFKRDLVRISECASFTPIILRAADSLADAGKRPWDGGQSFDVCACTRRQGWEYCAGCLVYRQSPSRVSAAASVRC